MQRNQLLRICGLALIAAAVMCARERNAGAIILVNSQAPDYSEFHDLIEPYLVQFGVPYEIRDISKTGPASFDKRPLGDQQNPLRFGNDYDPLTSLNLSA
jgi:hypothetical protein